MKLIITTSIAVILLLSSCRDRDNPLDDFFQKPPVTPITKTIKQAIPVGYAASLAMAHFKGFSVPNAIISINNGATIMRIDVSTEYPYVFKDDEYNEIIVVAVQTSENVAIASVFFTESNIRTGDFRLTNVKTFPVIYDDEKITAIMFTQDINVGGETELQMNLTEAEINLEINKLDTDRPATTEVAITQNGWIVDIYHNYTMTDFSDDEIMISGGEQMVDLSVSESSSSTSTWQIGMLDVKMTPECIRNPKSGDAFLQELEISESGESLDGLVFGKVWYTFHNSCDGDVEITVATGNFITSIGKEIDLGLN